MILLYVFMERNGIHIIDLNKTVGMLDVVFYFAMI